MVVGVAHTHAPTPFLSGSQIEHIPLSSFKMGKEIMATTTQQERETKETPPFCAKSLIRYLSSFICWGRILFQNTTRTLSNERTMLFIGITIKLCVCILSCTFLFLVGGAQQKSLSKCRESYCSVAVLAMGDEVPILHPFPPPLSSIQNIILLSS